jgi:hypothetical protein
LGIENKRQLKPFSYQQIHIQYPDLRIIGDIPLHLVAERHKKAYMLAMQVLRIGPVSDTFLPFEEWEAAAKNLGLMRTKPITSPDWVRPNYPKQKYHCTPVGLCTSVWETPYLGRDNPNRRIIFRR